MLIPNFLKGLTDDFDNFETLCKFSKDEKIWIVLRDLVNFESDKRQGSNDERPEPTFFGGNRQKPKVRILWDDFCGKKGHKEVFFLCKTSNKGNMKCHNCGTSGHLAKDCRKPKQNKQYCSFKMNNHDGSHCRKLKTGTSNIK